jgi:hypothetical protein
MAHQGHGHSHDGKPCEGHGDEDGTSADTQLEHNPVLAEKMKAIQAMRQARLKEAKQRQITASLGPVMYQAFPRTSLQCFMWTLA